MNPQPYIPDSIREEIEFARALTALLMAMNLHYIEPEGEAPDMSPIYPNSSHES